MCALGIISLPVCCLVLQYNVNVKENQADGLILRIPIEDKDLVNTPNWKSQFVIAKGNENGNFRVETDPKTNDGLLYIAKVSWHSALTHVFAH